MRFMSAILLGGQSAAAIIPKMNRDFWRRRHACFAKITGRLYHGAHWPVVQGHSISNLCLSGGLHREIAMLASKQKRGSNEARYGIIRGLKPFQMTIRPRR